MHREEDTHTHIKQKERQTHKYTHIKGVKREIERERGERKREKKRMMSLLFNEDDLTEEEGNL
jgi:hypothetical protein